MEDTNLLDPNSSVDLYALHYVFLPRLQHSLDSFAASYSHRPLRTESNRTPKQLWIQGQILDPKRNFSSEVHINVVL